MTDLAKTAKHHVDLVQKQIVDQQARIARQRELIVRLESDSHTAMSAEAQGMLKTMEKLLSHMTADHAAAEERLSQVSVDEQSLEKVERDCPM
ncbi:MAG: hypothetical protein WBD95_07075 [Xanthobacteraceae bacterium]